MANDVPHDGQAVTKRRLPAWLNPIAGIRSLAASIRGKSDGYPLFTHHTVIKELGRGGFGKVYLVQHKYIRRQFAIKVLTPYGGQPPSVTERARFLQEATMLFSLEHPSIVRVYDVGVSAGAPYIVMEHVDGEPLTRRLLQGRLQPDEARPIIVATIKGMAEAHRKGIIHRDFTPGNLMLGKAGSVKIIDFGLGLFKEQELRQERLTQMGQRPAGGIYTAPELIHDPTLSDFRSDIYSIGAVWCEMVTGRSPVGGNIPARLRDVDGLSIEEQQFIVKCLEDETGRYQSCELLLTDIEAWQAVDESHDDDANSE